MKQTIAVTITDAQTFTRTAIKHYLNSVKDIDVILDTGTGTELVRQLRHVDVLPDICLLECTCRAERPANTGAHTP